jgi:hypothetical protein
VITRLHLTQPHVLIVGVVKMMSGLVSMQIRLLVKPLMAPRVCAGERFLSCVDAHVCLEIKIERKLLSALLALVGLLSSVNEHVSLEFCVVQEALLAAFIRALEQFITVHGHVLFERGSVVESFPT